jgi:subtilisin family serine protease
MKTATIYLTKRRHSKLKGKVARILDSYDNFLLVEATEDQIESLRKEKFKVVVRDEIESIKLGDALIDTKKHRYDRRGNIRRHRAYGHTRDPGPQPHHYIVQFIGPIKEQWKQKIKESGGIICDPLPSYAYVVEMNGRVRKEIADLPFVRWVGHYDPSYRLASDLSRQVAETEKALAGAGTAKAEKKEQLPLFRKQAQLLPKVFLVSFHTQENLNDALDQVQALGFVIQKTARAAKALTVRFTQNPDQFDRSLKALAATHGVRSIEPLKIKQLGNDVATRIMTDSLNTPPEDLPYTGQREIVAVADTGLDTGDAATIHEDLRGRIAGIRSWPINSSLTDLINNPGGDDGPADRDSGHGTHVTGSILGDGTCARKFGLPLIRGLAYRAHLYFQAIEQKVEWKWDIYKNYYGEFLLVGLPQDLSELFQDAYDNGARIHSNSWGSGDFGAYDEDARDVDRFVWENKDMVILFAASNYGEDRDADGIVNPQTITPPGTAKNCIMVGASENLRKKIRSTYRDGWSDDFPADPIATDFLADDISDIAAFSGRGPCQDERCKPDVVAPGTFILSTRSHLATGNGWGEFNNDYFYMGGTSMATPLTAGAVALIREYLRRKRRRMPSAALVKAALVHTAVRRPYRHGATRSSAGQWDREQGWGHVNLTALLNPPAEWNIRYTDISKGLYTGDGRTYWFTVKNDNHPLKVTLVWSDYPAGVNQYPSLVNNLNLIVTASDGADYHGNVFQPPYDQNLDGHNNVEVVFINKPPPGRYKIRVVASDIKEGPQHFGLAYSGSID